MELVIINRPQALHYQRTYRVAKRALDIVLCLLALPVFLPLMIICAIAIRLDSPGPVIFAQERVGKGGRAFRIYKFRTMQHRLDDSFHRVFMKAFVNGKVGCDDVGQNGRSHRATFVKAFVRHELESNECCENGEIYKPIQRSQVTRVGRILRKTSLDELPQVFNVLRGEMSIVGPRPNVPWEVEEYKAWHHERLEVLPGITGLAQVRGRSGISFDNIVRYDIEYVERQSLALDLKVLWWTLSTVFLGKGAS